MTLAAGTGKIVAAGPGMSGASVVPMHTFITTVATTTARTKHHHE